jgi:hypothetical protein
MELVSVEPMYAGRFATFRVAGAEQLVELYVDDWVVQVCHYPGWNEMEERRQRDVAIMLAEELATH